MHAVTKLDTKSYGFETNLPPMAVKDAKKSTNRNQSGRHPGLIGLSTNPISLAGFMPGFRQRIYNMDQYVNSSLQMAK